MENETESTGDGPALELKLRALGWPPALAKAAVDPFEYALGLKNGTVLHFEEATDCGNGWALLKLCNDHNYIKNVPENFNFERGIEIRVQDIVWATDAPQGS